MSVVEPYAPIMGLNRVSFIPAAQIEAGAANVNGVGLDLVAQQPPRLAIEVSRHFEASRDVLEVRDEHQRDVPLLLPRHRGDLSPPHETGIRPDAVAVKTARDAGAERKRNAVVDEHHRFAEQLVDRPVEDEELEREEQRERAREPDAHAVIPDRKSTRLNSSHVALSRTPSSA